MRSRVSSLLPVAPVGIPSLFALALLALAPPAWCDRVVLANGRVLEGQARELPTGEVEISSSMGVLRIPAERVARIESSETFDYRIERLARRPGQTATSIYLLALEAEGGGAITLAGRLLRRVLELDPNHQPARERLGYRLHQGRWVTLEEWHQLRGLVRFRGEWMTPADRSRVLYLEASSRQIAQQRRLESERYARLQARQAEAAPSAPRASGIPLGYVWSPVAPHAAPPAFVPLPSVKPAAAAGRVTPPGTGSARAPRAAPVERPPGRAATGRFEPGGG